MTKWIPRRISKRTVDFLSVFLAVFLAFALDNWRDNRKSQQAERKILEEISGGIAADLKDLDLNVQGHQIALMGCERWKQFVLGKEGSQDTLLLTYQHAIFRDFVSLQNSSGYETLKSRGLELIQNDSLRRKIISLYEQDYEAIKLFEEEYQEMQYFSHYHDRFTELILPYIEMDEKGNLVGIEPMDTLDENERKELLLILSRISINRQFVAQYYTSAKEASEQLDKMISRELE